MGSGSWGALALVVGLLAGGCSPASEEPTPRPGDELTTAAATSAPLSGLATATAVPSPTYDPFEDPSASVVAEAAVPSLLVRAAAGTDAEVLHTLTSPTEIGGPLVFLVRSREDGWLEVDLPVRPNGSVGWIAEDDVSLSFHHFHVLVELAAHRVTVTEADEVLLEAPIGVGTQDTPTPGGRYYIKELLQPPDPDSVYGSYAFGLSGFSNVLTSFAGGEGVIGLHGTNDPSSIGTDVSHGCIRMHNADIERLVGVLPLGTPVTITE